MRINTTIKSFTLALALTATLTAPLLAAGRDDARSHVPQRDTGVITRVIKRLTNLIHALGETLVVPQPVANTTT